MRRNSTKKPSLKSNKEMDLIAAELMKVITADAKQEHSSEFLNEVEGNVPTGQNQILSRAKNLKKKTTKRAVAKAPKNDPFLTNILITHEEQKEDIPMSYETVDDSEVIKNLQELEKEDDLAELRRMIRQTKQDITEYAGGVASLKRIVDETYRDSITLGRKNMDNEMYGIDLKMEKLMPKGEAAALWRKKLKNKKEL